MVDLMRSLFKGNMLANTLCGLILGFVEMKMSLEGRSGFGVGFNVAGS